MLPLDQDTILTLKALAKEDGRLFTAYIARIIHAHIKEEAAKKVVQGE
jgi:hypothetical protein